MGCGKIQKIVDLFQIEKLYGYYVVVNLRGKGFRVLIKTVVKKTDENR